MMGKNLGNYQITEEMAYTRTGMIYRAHHVSLPREVVIREISLSAFPDSTRVQLKARYRREIFIQAQLDHPGIVRLYESFSKGENYYIVSEYVPGISLRELLETQGLPTPGQALFLCKQALMALDYAHTFQYLTESDVKRVGIIHRDLKPANLLIDPRGRLKIRDFGIVKLPDRQSMAPPSFRPGTAEYMPPEQLRGLELDARSDIYSLGVAFYQLLTGYLPFSRPQKNGNGNDPDTFFDLRPTPMTHLRSEIPPTLDAVFARAIHRNPSERFQTAAAFLNSIKEYEESDGAVEVQSRPVTSAPVKSSPEEVTIVKIATEAGKAATAGQSKSSSTPSAPQPNAATTAIPQFDSKPQARTEMTFRQLPASTTDLVQGEVIEDRPERKMTQRIPLSPQLDGSQPGRQRSYGGEAAGDSYESDSQDLFKHWEGNSGGPSKSLVIAATVILFISVLGGIYLLSLRKNATQANSSKVDSGQTAVSAAAPTATPIPIPTVIPEAAPSDSETAVIKPPAPEAEKNSESVSSGDIRKLQKARKADKLGSFRQATRYYNDYMDSGPTDADAAVVEEQLGKLKKFMSHITAAKVAYRRRNYESARSNYAEALKLRPYSRMVQSGLSRATARLGGSRYR